MRNTGWWKKGWRCFLSIKGMGEIWVLFLDRWIEKRFFFLLNMNRSWRKGVCGVSFRMGKGFLLFLSQKLVENMLVSFRRAFVWKHFFIMLPLKSTTSLESSVYFLFLFYSVHLKKYIFVFFITSIVCLFHLLKRIYFN